MNGKNNTGKILLVVVLAALFVVMCFLTAQRMGSYVGLRAEINMEKLALEQDQQRLDQLVKLSEQEKSITDTIEACKKLMPDDPQEDELIKYIQKTASEAMSDFIQINFEPRAQANNYSSMPVKITFEGNYSTLIDFLDKLRNGERAVRIDGVSVTLTNNGVNDIKAEIAANAFYTSGIIASNSTTDTATNGTANTTTNTAQ